MNSFTLLYVEDDFLTQKIVKSVLDGYFKKIYIANNGQEGIELYREKSPDIILADISMPIMNGLEMSQKIKQENSNQRIVLFTSYSEIEYFSKAINMKVDKYILKPLNTKQMIETLDEVIEDIRKERIEEAYKRDLEFASNHDVLTGLANRKRFFFCFKKLREENMRIGKIVAVLSVDLNNFKPINDTYGHDAGDLILKIVAKYLKKSLRKTDIISRFGGDEFILAIGFLETPQHILKFLERLKKNFMKPVLYRDDDGVEHSITISFSMGITFSSSDSTLSFDTLLRQADRAMYKSKRAKIPYAFFDSDEISILE